MRESASSQASRLLEALLTWRSALWVMVWLNIEADYGNLIDPRGGMGYVHAVRAVLAFAAAAVALVQMPRGRHGSAFAPRGPIRLMTIYAVLTLGASMLSDSPFKALYWGGLYVSVFIVLEAVVAGRDPLEQSVQLLTLTWLVVAALALVLAWVAIDVLFGQPDWLTGGREVINEIPKVAGMTMSRSTGIGRLAAVPAVIAIAAAYRARGAARALWGIVFCVFTAIVLATRGRTPLLGLAVAGLLVLLLRRDKSWLVLAGGLAVLLVLTSAGVRESVGELVYRRGPDENLMRMTGRTEVWQLGWEVFLRSPLLGLGPLADRFHLDWTHIHNTWLLALMQSGVVGASFFVAAWVIGWRLFFRCFREVGALPEKHRTPLVMAGAIYAFFTVRSITETTAAAFSVDLLVIVPVLAYLEILDSSLRRARMAQWQALPQNGNNARWRV